MNQKTEWEIVDQPDQSRQTHHDHVMNALLGRQWRWKVAGMAAVAGLILTAGIVLAGIFFIGVVAVALVLIVAAQFRQWFARAKNAYHGKPARQAAPTRFDERIHRDHSRFD